MILKSISTHTSRVGCDYGTGTQAPIQSVFLLTHPVWDVTLAVLTPTEVMKISTHTSRVGCDAFYRKVFQGCNHFYSHIPCGM